MTKYIYIEKARLRNFYLTQELRERFYSWNEIVEVVDLKKTKKGQKGCGQNQFQKWKKMTKKQLILHLRKF